jgi:hypothetical protein
VELRRHSDDHVIEVGVEVTTLGDIKTEGWVIVVTGQQVVGVVDQTGGVGGGLGELRGPHTVVGILGLMNGEVGWPDSIMDLSLSEVPLLEVVSTVLLVSRMDFGGKDHLVHKFSLLESLVDQEIVLLMHSSVAALARSLEDLEPSSQAISE